MIRSGGVQYHDSLKDLLTPIEAVAPHPANPNNGDEEAIGTSIEVNGMYRPVEVQSSTGYILAGNTTYAACLGLGADLIPVIWLDVDDETALRIMLGDNQIARLARMDEGLLGPQLSHLLTTELRLLGTGYTEWVPPPPPPPEPGYTITATLRGEEAAQWFDVPGETDRDRITWLLGARYAG